MKFSLGCDPECFLQDAAGSLISAINRIGGTKHNPQPLPIGDGFAVQEDNVALEYNIPPSQSQEEFTKNVQRAMYYLSTRVAEMGLQFSPVSAASFPMEQLMDPRAMEFGCDPDFNAWRNGRKNPRPKADDHTLRTCGGHVHVGHDFTTKRGAFDFIKFMDLYLGVGSVLMDKGEQRKLLYGKAGACRIKPYGVEYRSLSNFWVFNSKLTDWVWNSTATAMEAWQADELDINEEGPYIIEAINNNNKDIAQMLVDKHKLELVYA